MKQRLRIISDAMLFGFLSACLFLCIFGSCENSSPAENSEPGEKSSSHSFDKMESFDLVGGYGARIWIYTVDGVEYLVTPHGGICPLIINEKTDSL